MAFLILSLLCQENISLIAIAFAFYALLNGRRGRWFHVPLILGLFYFILMVFFIMPRLNDKVQFIKIYSHFGNSISEVIRNLLSHPIKTLTFMFSAPKLAFLGALLAPVSFLSLLSPVSLIPICLVAAQRLLSLRASEATIAYHYQSEFIPFIFFSAVYGAKRLLNLKRPIVQ